jgi:hypothetical protein
MVVRQQNSIRWLSGSEEARYVRNSSLGDQFVEGLALDRSWLEGLAGGVHQRKSRVENDAGLSAGKLNTAPTDFVGAAVDGELHRPGLPFWPDLFVELPVPRVVKWLSLHVCEYCHARGYIGSDSSRSVLAVCFLADALPWFFSLVNSSTKASV